MTLKQLLLTTALGAFATTALCQPGPVYDFECQVTTESGARGLVGVMASSTTEAAVMAAELNAYTDRKTWEAALDVVECVNRSREQRFSDDRFEWWSTHEVDR